MQHNAATLVMIVILCCSIGNPFAASSYDSLAAKYKTYTILWDTAGLTDIADAIDKNTNDANLLRLRGQSLWRLQVVANSTGDKKAQKRLGELAVSSLKIAREKGADPYETLGYETLATFMLAGVDLTSGALYGPKSGTLLKELKSTSPGRYLTRMADALSILDAPSFAGGNPAKATTELSRMVLDYPDSVDLRVHYARALIKTGKGDEARAEIAHALKLQPKNINAIRLRKQLTSG